MLVLTRNTNESIQIGDDIEIKILELAGDQVKLGINAPKSLDVHRGEIYAQIQTENTTAASLPQDLLKVLSEKGEK